MIRTTRSARLLLGVAVLPLALALASCSSSDSDGGSDSLATTTTAPEGATRFDAEAVGAPTVEGPITGGKGKATLGPGGLDLTKLGYVEEEFFLDGKATTYTSKKPLGVAGRWSVQPGTEGTYRTRILVRRPAKAADFNGSVAVEWLNVSGGLDAGPDWTFAHVELIRSGWAWVGVSAQKVGIEGGTDGPGAVLALKTFDPERYGSLDHPGDDYSYDLYQQAGAVLRTESDKVLGGFAPKRVIAVGESQSAFRLTTYVNAIQPLAHVYDGFLIHSRSGSAAPLNAETEAPTPTFIRTDQPAPVFTVSSESDVVAGRLGYGAARQQDTDRFRSWEIAGTAHGDAYSLGIGDRDDGSGEGDAALFDAMFNPPSSIYSGVISCDAPINAGPETYVVRAAFSALDRWIRTDKPPVSTLRLQLTADRTSYKTDRVGIAVGGVRTPQVDAPVAVLSGLGQTGDSFCFLFGTTKPFGATKPTNQITADRAAWLVDWDASIDEGVAAGTLLQADADQLKKVARDWKAD